MELNKTKAKSANLKTSLNSGALRVNCLERKLIQLKATRAEEVHAAIRFIAADQSVRGNAFKEEVTVLRHARKDIQAELCLLTESHQCNWGRTLHHHELIVTENQQQASSFFQQAKKAEKNTTNVENRLEAVFCQCSLLCQVVGARSVTLCRFLKCLFQEFLRDLS